MRIRTRIISIVFILLVLMGIATAFALREVAKIGYEINEITEADIPLTEILASIRAHQLEQAINFERALRFAKGADSEDTSVRIPIKEANAEFSRLGTLVGGAISDGQKILSKSLSQSGSERTQKKYVLVQKELEQIKNAYAQYELHGRNILDLLEQGKIKEATLESLSITGEEEEVRRALEALLGKIETVTKESSHNARRVQQTAFQGMAGITLLGLILGLALAFYITRSITVPLNEAVTIADQIAEGKKDVEIHEHYIGEVGQLLAAMKNMLEAVNDSEQALKEHAAELARSNAELEQFAYIASHDLQEPLRVVSNFTQLLAKRYQGKLGSDADEFIGFTVDGVSRMKSLINGLLTYSLVGKGERNLVEVEGEALLEQAISNLEAAIEESSALVTHDPFPTLRCEQTQMVQLLQNLVANAIKFRGGDTPKIHLGVEQANGEWVFSVKDNGIGIESQYNERIFNIFQRLHTIDDYPGTGIGLAICKKIVEQHKGRIWLESALEEGSTFYFTLPIMVKN